MGGGKYNPAVLWHKLGYRSNKIVGVVKTILRPLVIRPLPLICRADRSLLPMRALTALR